MSKYTVRRNHCDCHRETCNCNDWVIYVGEEKHSTYFGKDTADEVCTALNYYADNVKDGDKGE